MVDDGMLARRVRAQWLAERAGGDAAGVVAHTAGVQAQDTAAARLAIRVRSRAATAESVGTASAERTVVRTWLMRGTLHMVAAEDVRWMLALFGARNAAGNARRRQTLGLDERTCARALTAIGAILAGGPPLSRADLVERLVRRKVAVDPAGQAPAHLVGYAAAQGLICRGPDLDGDEPGYVLLDEWIPPGPVPDGEAALAELTRRYAGAYGPASPADLAAWSGLPLGTARRGFDAVADELAEVATGMFVLRSAVDAPAGGGVVRLLGAFDTYLLGYRDRSPALPPAYAKRIQAGGGLIHPAVLVDGRIVGRWRLRRTSGVRATGSGPAAGSGRATGRGRAAGGGPAEVTVEPFGTLDPSLLPALADEAADLGRFLGTDVALGG